MMGVERVGNDLRKGYSRFAFCVIKVEVEEAAERSEDDHIQRSQSSLAMYELKFQCSNLGHNYFHTTEIPGCPCYVWVRGTVWGS